MLRIRTPAEFTSFRNNDGNEVSCDQNGLRSNAVRRRVLPVGSKSGIRVQTQALRHKAKAITLSHLPITGQFPSIDSRLGTVQFTSFDDFQAWRSTNGRQIAEWSSEDAGTPYGAVPGFCGLCGLEVEFEVGQAVTKIDAAGDIVTNWRETLVCPSCGFCNRVRAALQLSIQEFGLTPHSKVYVTEQFGRVYRWLKGHIPDVRGSEYILPGRTSGSRLLGINHEDVQDLSLATDSVSHVLTFDVLEHVPYPQAAFASFARVLRPGGRLIMTAPFTVDRYETTVRAVQHPDGHIEHLLPAEIHGDPLDPAHGCLCFRHFGWDTLEQLRVAGFADARVILYHDRKFGHLGGLQSMITASTA